MLIAESANCRLTTGKVVKEPISLASLLYDTEFSSAASQWKTFNQRIKTDVFLPSKRAS